MMAHADMWDRFLEWVRFMQEDWESDTDEYRKGKAVKWFNFATACSRDLKELKPTLQSWVPHIACFVVSRQIVWLGNPTKRAADACESFGALVKKLIKHNTCRRRVRGGSSGGGGPVFAHEHTRGVKKWRQTFARGHLEQAFRRVCVKGKLLHGEEDRPYLQRADWNMKQKGVKSEHKRTDRELPPTVRECMAREAEM